MEIDKSTGLPRLPEKYFWRIKEYEVEVRLKFETEWGKTTRHSYRFSIDLPEGSEGAYEYKIEKHPPTYSFWGKKKNNDVEYERYVGSHLVVTHRHIRNIVNPITERVMGADRVEVTKDNVLDVASAAFEKFEAHQARKALLGDYPPKSL